MNVTLTAEQLHVIWSDAIPHTDLPAMFTTALDLEPGTDQQRAEWRAAIRSELHATGVASHYGLSPDLVSACRLLADPRWAVDAWLIDHTNNGRAGGSGIVRTRGAADAETAALATLTGNRVTIARSSPYQLPAVIVGLAGNSPAATGRSISLPANTLFSAVRSASGHGGGLDRDELIDELGGHGLARGQASTIASILTTATRHGQFLVKRAGGNGTLRPGPDVIGFVDAATGRWAQLRTPGDGGSDWVTYTPANTDQLAAMITSRTPG